MTLTPIYLLTKKGLKSLEKETRSKLKDVEHKKCK